MSTGHPYIILAGQSNALGQVDTADLVTYASYIEEYDSVLHCLSLQHNIGAAQTAYEVAAHKVSWFDVPSVGQLGPELGIARNIPNTITHGPNGNTFIVKSASGATNLALDWNLDDDISGTQSWSKTKAFADLAMGAWGTAECMGVIFIQGEADAAVEVEADAYGTNLAEIIADSRTWSGNANLPWVVARLNTDNLATFGDTVRAAQDAVAAADPYVVCYNPNDDSIPLGVDDAHYDGDDLVNLGIKLGVAFDALITACT